MKSHEKDSLELLTEVYKDYVSLCGVDQDERDLMKIKSRIEHEGYKFLTLTLPTFNDGLLRALEVGFIETTAFRSFKKRRGVPILFGVFLSKVFDTTGVLLSEPDPTAIAAIRQLSVTFKKQKEDCDVQVKEHAFQRFKEVELELANTKVSDGIWRDYSRLCSILWSEIISPIQVWNTTPKHGPGSTADKLTSNKKYNIGYWPDRSEGYFPLCSFGLPNENAIESAFYRKIKAVSIDLEQPVRVIAVPKTAKTPRIIAIEPTCMQFMQQALSRELMHVLESHDLVKGHINFKSQKINRDLALYSSKFRHLSTLDLSEASDRVHNDLIAPMFASNPDLWGAIQACRSLKADVNGDIITLSKFASMGSALCFPVGSMYFFTLSVLGTLWGRNALIDRDSIIKAIRSNYVYGDDIITPVHSTPSVVVALEAFGLKVNSHKSFSNGYFRESCGCDAYNGVDVTPVYLRRMLTDNGKDASLVLSMVASSNQFYKIGLWLTATALKLRAEGLVGKIPVLGDKAEGVGWSSFTFKPPYTKHDIDKRAKVRWSKKWQVYEYQTLVAKPSYKKDCIDDYPALMKFFLEPSSDIIGGRSINRDMKRSSRFGTVTLKRRWTRPY